MLQKACPCVLRVRDGRTQVLVFEHPEGSWQLAKGTVEPGEPVEEAALRELFEESGIRGLHVIAPIVRCELDVPISIQPDAPLKRSLWHLFHVAIDPTTEDRDSWTHIAYGSEAEHGLSFRFFWFDLDADSPMFHAYWSDVFGHLRQYAAQM